MAEEFTGALGSSLSQPGSFAPGDTGPTAPDTQPFWPTVQDVARLIPARTKVTGGKELGTFNESTRPTDAAVLGLIDEASDDVLGKVQPIDYTLTAGSAWNAAGSAYERRIQRAIALYAAILIEQGYFPEQIRSNQSPVATLQGLYDSRIKALISEGETGAAQGMGVGGSGGGDAPADASWSFPDAAPGVLVGWASRW